MTCGACLRFTTYPAPTSSDRSPSAAAIAYTGDTGPNPLLAELGRDVDLYIIDATDRPGESEQTVRTLLTAKEAGQWAARAGAARVLLTHFWPGNDRQAAVTAAQEAFSGDVLRAVQGLQISLDPPTSSSRHDHARRRSAYESDRATPLSG